MQAALIFNRKSGFFAHMTPTQFEREFAGNAHLNIEAHRPDERDNLDIISERHGVHMGFRRSYIRNGDPDDIACASFVLPKGYGRREHLYDHENGAVSLEEAVKDGKHILIRLNQEFMGAKSEFNAVAEPHGQDLKRWVGHVHGYYESFSANSAEEVAQKLRLAKKYNDGRGGLSGRIWFLHRGVILPFEKVVINNPAKLIGLYNEMVTGQSGVDFKGYQVGFPRFMEFVSTKEKHENGLVFGNHTKLAEGKPLLTQLTCPTRNGQTDLESYRTLREHISDHETGVWVLASPYVKPNSYDPEKMSIIRWDISNQETQLFTANDNKKVHDPESGPSVPRNRVKPGIRDEGFRSSPSV